jgi:hypothetical protein
METRGADQRAVRRARRWLAARDLSDVEVTALLVARLRARDRSRWQALATGAVAVVVLVVAAMRWTDPVAGQPALQPRLMATMFGASLIALLVVWWALRAPRRSERRIARGLASRATHPVVPDWQGVVGRYHLVAATVPYLLAVGAGVAVAVGARSGYGRVTGVVFLLAVVVCGAVATAAVLDVLRRPVLAEDGASLRVDDLLRIEDARRALYPFPVAFLLPLALTADSSARWVIIIGATVVTMAANVIVESVEPTPGRSRASRQATTTP